VEGLAAKVLQYVDFALVKLIHECLCYTSREFENTNQSSSPFLTRLQSFARET